jgi:F-type H+-transporting ATPase subunit b
MNTILISSINLIILIGILVFKLRIPLREFVAQRTQVIHQEVQTARDMLADAHKKFDEFSNRLAEVEKEMKELRVLTQQDISAMKQRLLVEIQNLKKQILSDAKSSADSLLVEFKREIYFELTDQILSRAETLIKNRLTGEDRARIRQEFSQQLGMVQ